MTPQTKKILLWAFAGIAVIAAIILIVSAVRGNNSEESKYRDLYIKELDEKNQILREQVAAKHEVIEALDKAIVLQGQRDSAIHAHYLENQKIYERLNEKLKEIPVRIARIANNDDSIRAAFAR